MGKINSESFRRKVLDTVASIPKGSVSTYKEVAGLAGRPRAYRAVGNILNRNRNPAVPCHRVIKSDGGIGGYAWGSAKKAAILKSEGFEKNACQPLRLPRPQRSTFRVAPTSKVARTCIIIPPAFFRGSVLKVAENLVGKYLVRQLGRKTVALRIMEVEAYDGPMDLACHASRGRTARTTPMFGRGGRFYVYFCYGMHWMLNVVTGPENYPAAVLIRAAGDINGPARLTKFLKIGKSLNGRKACKKNGLWFEDRGRQDRTKDRGPVITKSNSRPRIKRSPRIGVSYAGPVWAKKPYRFTLYP